ncbi:MAG: hypothetical protein IKL89_01445 [Clostridia bacterium]|nr:hypothetical protein [Clostridia bacterium]
MKHVENLRNFILGTDWWTDCDDAVALRILARAHASGMVRLLGVVINACMELSVASLDAYLTAEGLSGIPLALDREATDFGGNPPYQRRLSKLPHMRENADGENPVTLYRRLIVSAERPVDILEIGYPQALAAFLASPADEISPLSGVELVSQNRSRLWMMAGKWDENPGRENNFCRNIRAASGGEAVCRLWPGEITFLGFEVGRDILSGGKLPPDDLLAQILSDHGSPGGRSSWDPMLVDLALMGDASAAGYTCISGRARVDARTGENYFTPAPDGPHRYVVRKLSNDDYRDRLNWLIAPECDFHAFYR